MKFVLEIELGNEAMRTVDDVAWALRETADKVHSQRYAGLDSAVESVIIRIRDQNGNTVGDCKVVE